MVDDLYLELREVTTVAMGLLAIVLVVSVWVRTKSLAPTIGALLVGSLALLGIANPDAISELIYAEARSQDGRCDETPWGQLQGELRSYCAHGEPPAVDGNVPSASDADGCDVEVNRSCGYSPGDLCDGDWSGSGWCWEP